MRHPKFVRQGRADGLRSPGSGRCRHVRFSRRGSPAIPVLDGLDNGRCVRAECPTGPACYEFRIQVAVNPEIRAPAERARPRRPYRTGLAQWPAVGRPVGHVYRSSRLDSQSLSGLSRAFSSASTLSRRRSICARSFGPGYSSRRLSRCCFCVSSSAMLVMAGAKS